MAKKLFCPFATTGCKTETHTCMYWKPRLGCELERLVKDVRAIPNLVRRLEKVLEEGKHLDSYN